MRPTASSGFPTPLYFCVLLVIILINVLPSFLSPTHEESLNLIIHSQNFAYKVSTYRNTLGNRCALIRCGAEYGKRLYHDSSCDIIFAEITHTKRNHSSRFCPVDYVHSQWETLSRTYNQGFTYVSDQVKLSVSPNDLPLDSKAVHFAYARNSLDISLSWFSVWPSNATRTVFRDWHRNIDGKSVKNAPEVITLNHARTCRAADVVCHSRSSTIGWQCDSARDYHSCMSSSLVYRAMRIGITALAVVIVLTMIVAMFVRLIPRLRGVLGTFRDSDRMTLKPVPVLCAALLTALAGEHWVVIVQILSRVVGVSFRHDLRTDLATASAEVYRAIPELQGLYNGYAYVFRDSNEAVRISGPGVSIVVALTSFVLFIKRTLFNGLLVRCLYAILVIRLSCDAIMAVVGRKKLDTERDEDDYIIRRSEIPNMITSTKDRGRTFLTPKDRNSLTAISNHKTT